MKNKSRFIQCEFYVDYDSKDTYIVLIEIFGEKIVGCYTTKLPVPYTIFPHYPFIKN